MKPLDPRLAPLVAVLMTVAATAGCGSKAPEATPPPPAPAAVAATPVPSQPTSEGVPVVTAFGVPECDTYVKKYMECVEGKVSGEQRDQLLATFTANQTKWRAMSTMREAAVALGIACRAASQKAKEELAVEYGCEF